MTPYSSSVDALVPDATESDIENTLCTIDCITSCRLDEFYKQILYVIISYYCVRRSDRLCRQLDLEALVSAVRALEALAHERTVARLKQESDDINSNLETSLDGSCALPYDPASVFLLETMVSIACQTPQYIEEIW